ncbi:hypothetical protein [Clostridium beijerinckii]|nr:hypothetical protein [Clostridium beijerinckii]NOV60836.1 translation initiation factor 2 alpha subunit (eIF-2alpha) [Clostridium beijerinckii]NOV73074.1 translation initiation factor 2 alpha subunit (eIF-2alpha) [Clostridium beijerinckii]NOW33301.1 translation initiation factor 2 alpha subunit (eIF-2alpha) [Clostridium beijerinckii]
MFVRKINSFLSNVTTRLYKEVQETIQDILQKLDNEYGEYRNKYEDG